jgi:hypothetical protein
MGRELVVGVTVPFEVVVTVDEKVVVPPPPSPGPLPDGPLELALLADEDGVVEALADPHVPVAVSMK